MNYAKLRSDIEHAINANSAENGSDTPDFIIGDFLLAVLRAFDEAVVSRDRWYQVLRYAPRADEQPTPAQEP